MCVGVVRVWYVCVCSGYCVCGLWCLCVCVCVCVCRSAWVLYVVVCGLGACVLVVGMVYVFVCGV